MTIHRLLTNKKRLDSKIDKEQSSNATTDLTTEDTNNDGCFQSEGSQGTP